MNVYFKNKSWNPWSVLFLKITQWLEF
jgi:hypothetical protein